MLIIKLLLFYLSYFNAHISYWLKSSFVLFFFSRPPAGACLLLLLPFSGNYENPGYFKTFSFTTSLCIGSQKLEVFLNWQLTGQHSLEIRLEIFPLLSIHNYKFPSFIPSPVENHMKGPVTAKILLANSACGSSQSPIPSPILCDWSQYIEAGFNQVPSDHNWQGLKCNPY